MCILAEVESGNTCTCLFINDWWVIVHDVDMDNHVVWNIVCGFIKDLFIDEDEYFVSNSRLLQQWRCQWCAGLWLRMVS